MQLFNITIGIDSSHLNRRKVMIPLSIPPCSDAENKPDILCDWF